MNLQLAPLFQDHVVLQRDRPLPVWGWCQPGCKATVRLGPAQATARAGRDGRWQTTLPPQPAAGPLTLTVQAGTDEVRLDDVWLGEVWLASGQSNMEMKVASCRDAAREIDSATHAGIRVFTTARVIALTPQQRVGGRWEVCTPDSVGAFTAVGYFFARELHRELGVAVGIIDSSWGGTVAEAWTSREGLLGNPAHRGFIDRLDRLLGPDGQRERDAFAKVQADWEASIPQDAGNQGEADGWHLPSTDDSDWKTMDLPTGWQVAGCDISGVFWFRRTVEIPSKWAGRELEVRVGACDKRDYTYYDGHFLGSLGQEDSPDAWRTPRVYRIPGADVKAGRRVIAVRVFSNIYQGGMIGPRDTMWVAPVDAPPAERLRIDGAWRYRIEQDYGKVESAPPPTVYGPTNPNTPTVLFNAMIAPMIPYALKGFLWYQGESNASRPVEYRTLFPNLIHDWRRVFGQGDLAFYWVQLANYMGIREQPTESNWAVVREAQRLSLDLLPHAGMAVIIDIGEAGDIHPKNKQDVGRRLAGCALANDYGRASAVGSSPLPRRATCGDGGSILVRFKSVAGGLAVRGGGPLRGFALAGADRVFHWADAAIEGADAVRLRCAAVPVPCWIRYAWADNPVCNLIGGSGLPASPFEAAIPCGDWLAETEP
jgi:sialate O-acetylesterase